MRQKRVQSPFSVVLFCPYPGEIVVGGWEVEGKAAGETEVLGWLLQETRYQLGI